MFRRLAACSVALIGLVAGLVIPAAHASEPPPSVLTVHGFLTRPSADENLLLVNYTITVQGGGRLMNAQLKTKVYPSTPVDVSSVQVDGTTVPSGTVTQGGSAMTIRIGLGADSVNGGLLGNGSYLVSYEQRRPTRAQAPADAATSAMLTFSRDGQPGSVASNSLPLTHPDFVLSIPPNSGEDKAAFLGTGRTAGYGAALTNRGGPASAATLTLRLPTGLRLDIADGVERVDFDKSGAGTVTEVSCAHGGSAVVTCPIGAVAHGADILLLIPVTATATGKPGTYGTFHLSVKPTNEPDQKASDNALFGRVKFTGIAVLRLSLKASATKVPVGKSVKITVRVHNNGPQAAGETFGILLADTAHFRVTKFSTSKKVPGPEYQIIAAPPSIGGIVAWNAGTIAAHHTATATLTLKAKSVGTTHVEFFGQSDAGDPGCDSESGPCGEDTTVTLHAIKAKKS